MASTMRMEVCSVNFPSLERALRMVPPEFKSAYEWFMQNEGAVLSRLPQGDYAPPGVEVKLTSQSGIHCPNYDRLGPESKGKTKYALSVHSSKLNHSRDRYNDNDAILRGDGTWLFEYSEHRIHDNVAGGQPKKTFNDHLMSNLRDGVPVGVLEGLRGGGYRVLGLAFVEAYNPMTGMFSLHGPVTEQTVARHLFTSFVPEELSDIELDRLAEVDKLIENPTHDESVRRLAEQVRREKQDAFRKELMRAYEGACSVTSTNVPQALQAAHIDAYRGRQSQLVQNGLLLRADIHLLYDAHLLTVMPGDLTIAMTDELARTETYGPLDGKQIRIPASRHDRPDDKLLDLHYRQFLLDKALMAS